MIIFTIEVVLLIIILIQDLQKRSVSWILLVALFIVLTMHRSNEEGIRQLVWPFLINSLIISFQLVLVKLWCLIKDCSSKKLLNKVIGLGDILFLYCITVFLTPLNYLLYSITGLILSLIIWSLLIGLKIAKERTVPLAGLLSIWLAILTTVEYSCTSINLYSDIFLLNELYGI